MYLIHVCGKPSIKPTLVFIDSNSHHKHVNAKRKHKEKKRKSLSRNRMKLFQRERKTNICYNWVKSEVK